jgi:hypothetical protein
VQHSISALWESCDAKKWRDALASYWEDPSVRNNLEVEKFMDKLDPETIRKSNSEGWHGFLRVYFNWKFKGTYLGNRLTERIGPHRRMDSAKDRHDSLESA